MINRALALDVCKGNQDAVEFLAQMHSIAHFFDDLTDRDTPMAQVRIDAALWSVLVDLPINPFYRANFSALNPVVVASILQWRGATAMEVRPTSRKDLEIAYVARAFYSSLMLCAAAICGGKEWAARRAPDVWRSWTNETFDEYVEELKQTSAGAAAIMTPPVPDLPPAPEQ